MYNCVSYDWDTVSIDKECTMRITLWSMEPDYN